ncbi:MAG: hypothetical protein ACTHK0_00725, partial [Ginsengibacter sp.]
MIFTIFAIFNAGFFILKFKNQTVLLRQFHLKLFLFLLLSFYFFSVPAQKNKNKIHILYTPAHPANSFIPSKTIGGDFDGQLKG